MAGVADGSPNSKIPDLKAPISGSDRDSNVLIKRAAMQDDVAFNIR